MVLRFLYLFVRYLEFTYFLFFPAFGLVIFVLRLISSFTLPFGAVIVLNSVSFVLPFKGLLVDFAFLAPLMCCYIVFNTLMNYVHFYHNIKQRCDFFFDIVTIEFIMI